jgi:GNAT superfamily N-acetyltransferase
VASPAYRYLVAEAEGRLAGVAAMRDDRHLYHLFIAPAAQGLGLARRLWTMLLEAALQAGDPGEFTVNSSLAAVPVYERFGFRAAGPRTEANGIAFVPMRLRLAGEQGREGV